MANAFMPSALTSLAGAGQQTLEQALAQREFQRRLAEQQQQLQRQATMDQFSVAMRLQDQGQQERDFTYRKERDAAAAARRQATDDRTAAKDASAAREKTNKLGILNMAREAGPKADPWTMRMMAIEAGESATAFEAPETPELRATRIASDVKARETAQRPFDIERENRAEGRRATRVAKDDPKAPRSVVSGLEARKGQPGFKTAAEAITSVKKHWATLKRDHPGLDLNAMERTISNIYGEEPTAAMTRVAADTPTSGGIDKAALRAKILGRLAAK